MKQLTSDETKFKKLTQNPKKARQDSLLTYLHKLRKDGILDDATFQKIVPSDSSPDVLYGLSTVHKSGCPFRPIVTSVNTYNYNLASQYLARILRPISTNQFTVKDSFSLQNGPSHLITTISSCALLMSFRCSPTLHLISRYNNNLLVFQ